MHVVKNYETGGMVEDDGLEGVSNGERKIQYHIYHSCYFVQRAIAPIHFANCSRTDYVPWILFQ